MTNAEGQVSDDWLADIFDADDDDAMVSAMAAFGTEEGAGEGTFC